MEPAQALADLTEISSELEVAVLADRDGSVVSSTLADEERAGAIASNAISLFATASDAVAGNRELTHVQAATREGCVFVVRDDRHVLAAVTGPDPTVGLVFYDLKTTLRTVAEEEPKPKPKPRAKRKRAAPKKSEEAQADA